MGWIMENVLSFITDFIGSVLDFFGELINNIFFYIVDMAVSSPYGQNAQKVMVALGFALVSLMVVKMVMSGYLLETDYDSDADPFDLLVRISETTAIISCEGWIFDFTLQLSKDLASDFISSTDVPGYSSQTQNLISSAVLATTGASMSTYVILILGILIAMLVFMFVSGLRGGELVAMKLFMPIFAIDLLTTNRERWNNFFMGYMLAFFSYAIQILFYTVAMKTYVRANFTNRMNLIAACIWMVLAIRAPKFLEKYMYKSGVSNAASSGIRMIAQTVMIKAV